MMMIMTLMIFNRIKIEFFWMFIRISPASWLTLEFYLRLGRKGEGISIFKWIDHINLFSPNPPLALNPFPTLEIILLAVKSVTLFFLIFNLTVLEHLWTSVFLIFFIFVFLFLIFHLLNF